MSDLAALIERLEKATGPDQEIDAEIQLTIIGSAYAHEALALMNHYPPYYTGALDAALALFEGAIPGWLVNIHSERDFGHHGRWTVSIKDPDCRMVTWEGQGGPGDVYDAPAEGQSHLAAIAVQQWNPALALCLALCRALLSMEPNNE